MTQIYTIRTDSKAALDNPEERHNPHHFRETIERPDTEAKADTVAELEDKLKDVEWAVVEYRHTTNEYSEPEYRDDPDYYHETHDLRTPPVIEHMEGYDIRIEHAGSEETRTVEPVEEGFSRTDTIELDGIKLGTVTVKQPIDGIPRSGISVRDYPDGRADSETVIQIGDEPESVPVSERVRDLEAATGKGGGPGERGIAHRIDELEDRVEALEG